MRFEDIVTLENIYQAWNDFRRGKRDKVDVMLFESELEDGLLELWHELCEDRYAHEPYSQFIVHDPKRRVIHKASVRDRIVHRLIYNALLPAFHRRWLDCSFSCRPGFGQHRSIDVMEKYLRQATRNWSKECWVLKCDVKKFFDSVDHGTLIVLLRRVVQDDRMFALLQAIIRSFHVVPDRGLPIGNLTSQLFANVYLHELDRFVKHELKQRWYLRYADDFVVIAHSRDALHDVLSSIRDYLSHDLQLELHPNKVILRKSPWGIDWLGHVLLPGYRVLRTSTRRRMYRMTTARNISSYHGLLNDTARKKHDQFLLQVFALGRTDDTIAAVGSCMVFVEMDTIASHRLFEAGCDDLSRVLKNLAIQDCGVCGEERQCDDASSHGERFGHAHRGRTTTGTAMA